MKNQFDDIKSLYQQKKAATTGSFREAKAVGENQIKKLKQYQLNAVITMGLTAGVIIYVDLVSSKKLDTSVPGFWILISCAIYAVISKWFLFRKLHAIDPALPALKMIEQLDAYKKWNTFLQTYAQFLYIIILSLGVYLYLLPVIQSLSEFLSSGNLKFLKFIWLAYLVWVFVYTFFIRRKHLLADTRVIDGYIKSLKSDC